MENSDHLMGEAYTSRHHQSTYNSALQLLFEYIDADRYPAFVVDTQESPVALVHANPCLQGCASLYASIVKLLASTKNNQRNATTQPELRWMLSTISGDFSPNEVESPLVCGLHWTRRVVAGRWAVIVANREVSTSFSPSRRNLTGNPASPLRPETNGASSKDVAKSTTNPIALGSLRNGGVLGDARHLQRLRDFDWASSSCGPIDQWPRALRQASEIALVSRDPVCILWGDDYTFVYNHSYSEFSGDQHPEALGRPFYESQRPEWEKYVQSFDQIRATGQAVHQKNVKRYFTRHGQTLELFFDLHVMPILDENAHVAGLLSHMVETTGQVLWEPRKRTLVVMNEHLVSATSLHQLWRSLSNVLEDCKDDFLFAAIYAPSEGPNGNHADSQFTLRAEAGMKHKDGSATEPNNFVANLDVKVLLQSAFNSGEARVLSTVDGTLCPEVLDFFSSNGADVSCRDLIIRPLSCEKGMSTEAVIVIGVNHLRKLDDDYQAYVVLVTELMQNAIAVIRANEERRQIREKAALDFENKLMLFIERAPVGIFQYEPDGTIKFCNPEFEQLVGMSQDELLRPMAWIDAVHPDSVEQAKEHWDKVTNLGGPLVFEVQFKKPWTSAQGESGGEYLDRTWCLVNAYHEVSENGRLTGILGCITNISHAKWAEQFQKLKLAEALEMKRQQENFLDITSHEMRNPLNSILHCASELTEQLTSLEGSQASRMDDVTLEECLDMASIVTFCANHQKRIIDDILTLSKLDSSLLQVFPVSTDPLKMVERVTRIFDAELRASKITSTIEVLEGYHRLKLDTLFLDAHRVSQIIINLFSNAAKFIKEQSFRHLRLYIDASLDGPPLGTEHLRLVPSGVHRQDPIHLEEWGTREVVYVSFVVEDTGPGMTEEEADSLFNRFSQASPRTHAQYGGSGLGLFISRELTEMHGGRIGLSSQIGSGSTFGFYVKTRMSGQAIDWIPSLPTAKSIEAKTTLPSGPKTQGLRAVASKHGNTENDDGPRKKRLVSTKVLIVEDNLINQRLLKKLITKHGYEATTANHGKEALALVEASEWSVHDRADAGNPPKHLDIVLCDIEMPVMDGKAFIRRVRELQHNGSLQPNIPVIAVTGNARYEQVKSAKECGFDDVVTKPYKIEELIVALQGLLERSPDVHMN